MEAMGKRKRLEMAMSSNEKIKLIFQYPATERAIVKSGYVKETYEDGFCFDEIIDGIVVYAYTYLIEIKEDKR